MSSGRVADGSHSSRGLYHHRHRPGLRRFGRDIDVQHLPDHQGHSLVIQGSRFIATNPTRRDPRKAARSRLRRDGSAHREGRGKAPFFVGKPNPLMRRTARNTWASTPRTQSWWAIVWTPNIVAVSKRYGDHPGAHGRHSARGCRGFPLPPDAHRRLRRGFVPLRPPSAGRGLPGAVCGRGVKQKHRNWCHTVAAGPRASRPLCLPVLAQGGQATRSGILVSPKP